MLILQFKEGYAMNIQTLTLQGVYQLRKVLVNVILSFFNFPIIDTNESFDFDSQLRIAIIKIKHEHRHGNYNLAVYFNVK